MSYVVLARVDHSTDSDARMDEFLAAAGRETLDDLNTDGWVRPGLQRALLTPYNADPERVDVIAATVDETPTLWLLLRTRVNYSNLLTMRFYWQDTFMYGRVVLFQEEQ